LVLDPINVLNLTHYRQNNQDIIDKLHHYSGEVLK